MIKLGSNPKGGHSTYTLALFGCTLELCIKDTPGHTVGRDFYYGYYNLLEDITILFLFLLRSCFNFSLSNNFSSLFLK